MLDAVTLGSPTVLNYHAPRFLGCFVVPPQTPTPDLRGWQPGYRGAPRLVPVSGYRLPTKTSSYTPTLALELGPNGPMSYTIIGQAAPGCMSSQHR